jgi:hypothetical protein
MEYVKNVRIFIVLNVLMIEVVLNVMPFKMRKKKLKNIVLKNLLFLKNS